MQFRTSNQVYIGFLLRIAPFQMIFIAQLFNGDLLYSDLCAQMASCSCHCPGQTVVSYVYQRS